MSHIGGHPSELAQTDGVARGLCPRHCVHWICSQMGPAGMRAKFGEETIPGETFELSTFRQKADRGRNGPWQSKLPGNSSMGS